MSLEKSYNTGSNEEGLCGVRETNDGVLVVFPDE